MTEAWRPNLREDDRAYGGARSMWMLDLLFWFNLGYMFSFLSLTAY